jgi:hypothetical protein
MSQNITQKLSAGVARVLLCLLVSEAAPLSANQDTPGAQAAEAVVGGLNLVIVEGDGAVNNLKARTAREAIVQVEDSNHKPVAGALVTFTASGAGPTGVFGNGSRVLTLLTNSKGQAVMQGLKTNHVAGALKINVTASFHGQTATAAITQTNAAAAAGTSAAAGGLLSVKAIAIIAGIGAAAIGGIVAGLAQGGSSSAKTNQGTTISPGAVTIGTPH